LAPFPNAKALDNILVTLSPRGEGTSVSLKVSGQVKEDERK